MKKGISIGIIFLFIVTAVSPMVIGYTSVMTEQETPDEEYAYNRFNDHYYPEGYLTGQYPPDEYAVDVSSREVIEYEDNIVTEKKHQKTQPAVTSGGPMDSPWPMFMHDVRHTGRSPYSTADNPYDEKWWFKMSRSGSGSPVIDNEGVIYTGSDELYAIYPNGTLKWKYDDWYGVIEHTAPAIDENGAIYVGLAHNSINSKNFYAFYPNGTVKWTYAGGDDIFSSPAIGDDGVIYFTAGKKFHAVYPNGTLKWKYTAGDYFWGSSPAIGLDGTVYCGAHDDYVYAWYPNNGTVKWKYNTGTWVHGSPTIGTDGTVYIGSDNSLYALYPNNGTMKWRCNVGGIWSSPTLGVDGTIYVGVFEEKFYAVYPNGTIKWTFNAGGRIWFGVSAAISADGTIYFGTTPAMGGHGGDFIVLNPDGTEKMRDSFGYFESSPAIAEDGTVYIVSTHGAHAYSYLRAYGSQESNSPPEPPMITGEINGTVRTEYRYTFVAIDPDNNPVSYFIDWGDARNDETRLCASGERATVKHKYLILGNYTIRAKAKDTLGEESDWAYLEVTMPKNQQTDNMWFLRWLERFPILNQIVNLLMEKGI